MVDLLCSLPENSKGKFYARIEKGRWFAPMLITMH